MILKITFWSRDQLRTYSFRENGAGLKNQITIILFKIWPTNRFSKAKSYNFHFNKNDVTWPLSANGLSIPFHCHTVNTAHKKKLKTVQWKKPRKSSVTTDWYINNFSKSQVYVAHSFRVICRNISRTIVDFVWRRLACVASVSNRVIARK